MTTRPIDEKIVVMKLDNSDFERKVTETTSIFGKLKSSLSNLTGINLGKVSNEFSNIQKSANGVNLGNLSSAVDAVTNRFSNLGVVATTALMNITNRAVDAGARLAKSLGPEQVMDGFREYELKMSSIQTILANTASKGTTLDDVKRNFEELNAYADRTIYSFADMTRNIGLFTNAGLALDDSTSMIKGFSNAAAASGAGATEAARAAYQLSQALSQGYVMQMDWMSLTNAGMGNDNMKRDLIAIAQAMGTLDKSTEYTLKNWKEMLTDEKWLTSDVMSNYLNTMAGAFDKATLMSQGLSEAQADLLLQNAKVGEQSATYVRTFTQMMGALKEGIGSGWAESWEIIFGDFEEATKFWTGISKAVEPFFTSQATARNNLLRRIFGDDDDTQQTAIAFTNILQTLQNVIKPMGQTLKIIGNGFRNAFPPSTTDGINRVMESFKDFTSNLRFTPRTVMNLETIFTGLFSVLSIGVEILKGVGSAFLNILPGFEGLGAGIVAFIAKIAQLPINIDQSIKSGKAFDNVFGTLVTVFSTIGTGISKVGSGFQYLAGVVSQAWSLLSSGELTKGPWADNSFIVSTLISIREGFLSIGPLASSIGNSISSFFNATGEGFNSLKDALFGANNVFKRFFDFLAENQGWLLAGGGIAGLATIGWKLYEFFNGIAKPLSKFGEVLDNAGDALGAFTLGIHVKSLFMIAAAVALLAGSFKLIEGLNGKDIANGLYMIIGSLTAMVGALAIMSKYDITGSFGATLAIIGMAGAMLMISKAVDNLAGMDFGKMIQGIGGVVVMLGSLAGAMTLMGKFGGAQVTASALQILAVAAGITLMATAINDLGNIDLGVLVKGVGAIAGLLVALGTFLALSKGSTFGPGSAIGILAIAGSVKMLASSIEEIGLMNIDHIKQAMTTISVFLATIALFSAATAGAGLMASGAGVLLIAGALNALIIPLQALGTMDPYVLIQGLAGLAVALTAIGVASMAMTGMIPASIGLTVMAGAITLLLPSITALGLLPWDVVLKGIGAMVFALAALGATAGLLTPVIVPMLGVAAAIAAIGLAVMAAGAGLTLFGKGLLVLAGLGSGAVVAIVATLGSLIAGFAALVPAATDLAYKLMINISSAIEKNAPKIAEIIANTLLKLLEKVSEYLPKFIKVGADIIVNILNGLEQHVPRVIQAMASYVMTLVNTMADTLEQNGTAFTDAIKRLMGEALIIMVDAGLEIIGAIFGWIPGVTEATEAMSASAEKSIRDRFGASDVGKEKGTEFSDGLRATKGDSETAGEAIATAAKTAAGSVKADELGVNFGQGFAKGIGDGTVFSNVVTAAKSLASAAYEAIKKRLDINSPSGVTWKLGEYTGEGFDKGIASKEKAVKKTSGKVGKTAAKSMKDEFKATFNEEFDNIEHKFKMGTIDSEQYVAELEKLKSSYSKYPEHVRKVEHEIKKAQEDSAKHREELLKKEMDASKQWIEEKKYYNQLSMTEELEAWERIQARYMEGTEQRKEADREVYRVRNEIAKKMKDVNEKYLSDVQSIHEQLLDDELKLNDDYDKALSDRAKSLVNFVGIFDEIKAGSEVSGAQLLANLNAQVVAFKSWESEINKLASKAIDDGLLRELEQMGPKALAEVVALNTLTETELQRYSDLYAEKSKLATDRATKELEPMKENTQKQIEELRMTALNKLGKLESDWVSQIKHITGATDTELKTLEQIGKDAVQGLIIGMQSKTIELEKVAEELGKAIDKATRKSLEVKSPSRAMMRIGEFIAQGLMVGMENGEHEVVQTATRITKAVVDAFENNKTINIDDMVSIGADDKYKSIAESYNKIIKLEKEAALERATVQEKFQKRYLEIGEKYAHVYDDMQKAIDAKKKENEELNIIVKPGKVEAEVGSLFRPLMDEHSAAMREAYDQEHEALETFRKLSTQKFDIEKKFIEDNKKLKSLSLADEIQLYKRFGEQYGVATEQRMYYEDLIIEKKKEISGQIDKLTNDYDRAYSQRVNSLKSFASIFDEVKVASDVSGQKLLENLATQVVALEDWSASIRELAGKGVNDGLLAELQAMGPKAIAEIQALNSLTESELSAYEQLWLQKSEIARKQAEVELIGMKQDTERQIAELRDAAEAELGDYSEVWNKKAKEVTEIVSSELSNLEEVGADAVGDLITGMESQHDALVAAANNIGSAVAEGISNSISPVSSAATSLASEGIIGSMNEALDRNSPPGELIALGEDVGDGAVIGMNNKNKDVINAGKTLAESIKSGVHQSMYKAKEEYNNRASELNKKLIEDEKRLNDEYNKAVDDRAKKLYSFVGIFDKVEKKSGITGARLLRNLQSQVDTFRKWSSNMSSLSAKGVDQELLNELREMGPSAATEIAALNTLSESELQQYSAIWREKSALARTTAVDELSGMKLETQAKIEELRAETARQLIGYTNEWNTAHETIVEQVDNSMTELENNVNSKLQVIRKNTNGQLSMYASEWRTSIVGIKDAVMDIFKAMTEEMPPIGRDTIRGLQQGLSDMTPALMSQAQAIADSIAATIRRALQVKSPSRVTTEIGEWVGQGLVNGLANKIKGVVKVSKDLAISAKDSLNEFLDGFDMVRDDNEIHIKAIIDYDKFDPSRFVKMNAIPIEPDTTYTNSMVAATRESTIGRQSGEIIKQTTDKSTNFNPVTKIYAGASGKEIARENDKILRKLAYKFGV